MFRGVISLNVPCTGVRCWAVLVRQSHWEAAFGVDARVRPLLNLLAQLLVPIVFLVILWLVTGLLRQLTWPSFSYLLGIALSLATAWVVIRASTSLIRNKVMAKGPSPVGQTDSLP